MNQHSSRMTPEAKVHPAAPNCDSSQTHPPSDGPTRRSVLKSLARAAAAGVLPSSLVQVFARAPSPSAKRRPAPSQSPKTQNPRWYGFNLLEYYSTDTDWMKYFPYKNDGMYLEDDFRWIRDWGFNFVRLPMDYRFWTDSNDLMKIHEEKVEPIDRAIRLGEKYGIHVNICLHRAPGYCRFDELDPSVGAFSKYDRDHGNFPHIHLAVEKTDLFRDPQALKAFMYQWAFFAHRYKGVSNERLSFNLLNEPEVRLTREELRSAWGSSQSPPAAEAARSIHYQGLSRYTLVASVAIKTIRVIDPKRLVVSDGCDGGADPVPDLIDTGVYQSAHAYMPMNLTHYKAEWMPEKKGLGSPSWPLTSHHGNGATGPDQIEYLLQQWKEIEKRGVCIHFGETGCYKYTPHRTVMAWFNDLLRVIANKMNCGWALWNFRGPFGILDTERKGTKFEDWHGHQLDRALLKLLQKNMKA